MTWLLLGGFFVCSILGRVALGAALGITGLLVMVLFGNGVTEVAASAVYGLLTKFTLSAIPVFLIMGEILVASGLSDRVYRSIAPLFSRIPGQLVHTNIAACTVFGAVSGSSTATAAAVSSVSYPELSRRGYDKGFVIGSLAGGGTLGLLIPPSLPLIIYGAWQEVSIGALFLAGIAPGLMIAVMFSVYIGAASKLNANLVPEEEPVKGKNLADTLGIVFLSLLDVWPFLVLIAGVMGVIYSGLATLTEAAGIGVFLSIVLGYLFGELDGKKLLEAIYRAMRHFGIIAFVLIGAAILSHSVSIIGLPKDIIEIVNEWGLSKYQFIMAVMLLYIVLGCFFEGISLMLLTLPFLFPVVVGFGFDPIWFGIFVTIMAEIGLITPPVGLNLYFLSAISGNQVPMSQIIRSAFPYWVLLIMATILILVFPQIVLYLPSLVF